MADREFKIIITGDSAGLQSSAKEGASALQDELNPAVESFHKTWKAAGTETEEFAKRGEMKHMVRELKRDFPELGMLARVALNPLVGGFGLLLGTLKGIDEIFKGLIERSNTGIFSGTFRRDMAAATKEAIEAEVAWRSFGRTMEGVAHSQQSAKEQTDGLIESIRAHHVAVTEQQNAEKAAALARVDMLEKEGKLSGPQAINERLKVEEKFARAKLQADIVAKDAEIEAKRVEVKKLNADAAHEQENAGQYKEQMEQANRDLQRFEALKAGTQKALEETRKQIKALSTGALIGPGQMRQLGTARDLESQLAARMGLLGPDAEMDLRDAAKEAAERYNNSTKRAQELAGSAAEIAGKLPGEQARANQSYVDAGNVAATERMTRTYQATGQLAGQVAQMQEEVTKNVEAGKGVMVSLLEKMKEYSNALDAMQRQVDSLSSPARRVNNL